MNDIKIPGALSNYILCLLYTSFKTLKEGMNENLEKKRALCEKAEALKDSTDIDISVLLVNPSSTLCLTSSSVRPVIFMLLLSLFI